MRNLLTKIIARSTVKVPTHVKSYTQRRIQPTVARLGRATVREVHSRFACVGPAVGFSFRRPHIMATTLSRPVELLDAFDAALCKLKALELLLSTRQLHEALEADAVDGIAYLFGDVIQEFETLTQALQTA